jgi:hypothetical protein
MSRHEPKLDEPGSDPAGPPRPTLQRQPTILAADPIEGYRREDRDMRSDNLIYILVVIILVLVALLLLSQLI